MLLGEKKCIYFIVLTTTASPGSAINTLGPHHWRQIYHSHRRWAGTYQYRGHTYDFRLIIKEDVQGRLEGDVSAEKARFIVKGGLGDRWTGACGRMNRCPICNPGLRNKSICCTFSDCHIRKKESRCMKRT